MPYQSIQGAKDAGFPTKAEDVTLTIVQINHLAEIYDALQKQKAVENAMAVAWTTWKKAYKKEDDKWVKKEIKGGETMNKFFSLIDLDALELKETSSEIELLRIGSWRHPEYGKFDITEEDLTKFVENFENNVRGIELSINAEHEKKKGAAGWVKKLAVDGKQKLKALVDWTPWGQELIKQKIFKYISPEFESNYTDAEKGSKYKNVLFGAGLTNRPFLKGQPAISLSESTLIIEEVKKMEDKKGIELIETLTERIKNLEGKQGEQEEKKRKELEEQREEERKKLEEEQKKQTVSLAEHKALEERAGNLEKKLAEKDRDELIRLAMEEGKLTPKMRDEWANEYALKDPEGFKKFVERQEQVVKLGEKGSEIDTQDKSVAQEINDKALEKKKTESLNFSEAVKIVLEENPDLAKKY